MVERDEMQRTLELARASLRAPAAARARVRANLAAAGSAPPVKSASGDATAGVLGLLTGSGAGLAGPAGRAATYARAGKAALWVGLGLCAGYWLGASQVSERAGAGAVEAPAPVVRAPVESEGRWEDEAASSGAAQMEAAPPAVATKPTPHRRAHLVASARGSAGTPHADLARPDVRRAAAPAVRAPSGNPLGEEVLLLQRVERAIRAGDAALALSFLAELDRRFPVSPLREERAAARVLADCAQANVSTDPNAWREPRAVAERFLASRAGSVYSDRIRRSCGLEGVGATRGEGTDREPAVGVREVSRAAGH